MLLVLMLGLPISATFAVPIKARAEEAAQAAPAAQADQAPQAPEKVAEKAAEKSPEKAATRQVPHENFLVWVVKVSGLIGVVILGLSFYFVATVVRLFLELRIENVVPPGLVSQYNELLEQRDYRGILTVTKEDGSPLGDLLATGIRELPNGLSEARETMERSADAETVSMERKISMLAVLGTLGPMIGLLGTLKGMIASFSVIAMSDVQMKASEVAGGISEALLLTFEGVALSVPAIYFFALFRNRVAHLSVQLLLTADELLTELSRSSRQPPTPGKAPAPGAPGSPSA
jgi:biopolymer transport protein ExbB